MCSQRAEHKSQPAVHLIHENERELIAAVILKYNLSSVTWRFKNALNPVIPRSPSLSSLKICTPCNLGHNRITSGLVRRPGRLRTSWSRVHQGRTWMIAGITQRRDFQVQSQSVRSIRVQITARGPFIHRRLNESTFCEISSFRFFALCFKGHNEIYTEGYQPSLYVRIWRL